MNDFNRSKELSTSQNTQNLNHEAFVLPQNVLKRQNRTDKPFADYYLKRRISRMNENEKTSSVRRVNALGVSPLLLFKKRQISNSSFSNNQSFIARKIVNSNKTYFTNYFITNLLTSAMTIYNHPKTFKQKSYQTRLHPMKPRNFSPNFMSRRRNYGNKWTKLSLWKRYHRTKSISFNSLGTDLTRTKPSQGMGQPYALKETTSSSLFHLPELIVGKFSSHNYKGQGYVHSNLTSKNTFFKRGSLYDSVNEESNDINQITRNQTRNISERMMSKWNQSSVKIKTNSSHISSSLGEYD